MNASYRTTLKFTHAYLVLGPHHAAQKQTTAQINRLVSKQGSVAVERLWADECPVERLIAYAQNPPLFEDYFLIIYHNVDLLRGKSHGHLNNYLAKPNPRTILILTSSASSLSYAWTKKIPPHAKVTCWQPFQSNLVKEVQNIFAKYSLTIDYELAQKLTSSMEKDTEVVLQTTERLAQHCLSAKAVSSEIIERFFSFRHNETVFTLVDACLGRNTTKAVDILQTLHNSGTEPSLIAAMLGKALHNLLYLYSRPTSFVDACNQRGLVWKIQQNSYRNALSKFSYAECNSMLSLLYYTESGLRTGESTSLLLLTRLVVTFCEGAAPALVPRWPQYQFLEQFAPK